MTTPATDYQMHELEVMLGNGSKRTGNAVRAAVHLLLRTGVVDGRASVDLNHLVTVEIKPSGDGKTVACAFIKDWAEVRDQARWLVADRKLIALAYALATGSDVSLHLRNTLEGMSGEHALLAAEAILIAAGADEQYEVTSVPTT